MGFDFRPALKESIKSAGVPRGWSVSEHRGKVKLRVRAGAGGAAQQWTKTLPIHWEVGCIGPVTETMAALYRATQSEPPKSVGQAWQELHPEEEDSEPAPGVPTVIGGINWKAIAAAHYRDRQQNGKQVSDKTMALERTYCDKAVELLTSSKPPATPYKLMDAAITAGGWSDKPRARQQCVGAINRFLTYCVTHKGLSGDWIIPQHQKLMLAIPLRTPEGEDYPAGDLAAQINAGLMPFLPLKERGAAVAQYVGRLRLWKERAAAFDEQGKWLRPYSFRNIYSVRGHLRGIPGASMALAMGHSDNTHSAHDMTASEESTAELFERLLRQ